ncbi:MAG TPA: hypothetical protein VGV60_18455 [Candidatus Polarisedimenticolia bacterium]|nr:hypothetical protein [Candidatus Polarisedimenticolia bacterium]
MKGAGRAIRTVLPGGVLLLASLACGGAPDGTGSAATAQAPQRVADPSAPEAGPADRLSPLPTHDSVLAGPPGAAASGELAWTVPKEWIEEPPKSGMRKAQYRLPAASGDREDGECVVYYFGAGQGGDVKANLDRWAAQFRGWGTASPEFSEVKAGGFTISRAEVHGTYTPSPMSMGGGPEPEPKPGYMLLGAIVPGPDANWFFKCTGPEKTMEANRARFDALLGSVHGG